MPSYQCRFEAGDLVIDNGQVKTIMRKDEDENKYYMKKGEGGRLKWQDAMTVDSRVKPYVRE